MKGLRVLTLFSLGALLSLSVKASTEEKKIDEQLIPVRPGKCPKPVDGKKPCPSSKECEIDFNCPRGEKCCERCCTNKIISPICNYTDVGGNIKQGVCKYKQYCVKDFFLTNGDCTKPWEKCYCCGRGEKIGKCPKHEIQNCKHQCSHDAECPFNQKCCGRCCVEPIKCTGLDNGIAKSGYCVLDNQCNEKEYDKYPWCTEKKCTCCVKKDPVIKDNKCPLTKPTCQNHPECRNDGDCEGIQKCCDGCCTFPKSFLCQYQGSQGVCKLPKFCPPQLQRPGPSCPDKDCICCIKNVTKDGKCPPMKKECPDCKYDVDCPGNQKCCNGCCMLPQSIPCNYTDIFDVEHQGECKLPQFCRKPFVAKPGAYCEDKECVCCVKDQPNPGKCPKPGSAPCKGCFSDQQCEGHKKCCHGCCVDPVQCRGPVPPPEGMIQAGYCVPPQQCKWPFKPFPYCHSDPHCTCCIKPKSEDKKGKCPKKIPKKILKKCKKQKPCSEDNDCPDENKCCKECCVPPVKCKGKIQGKKVSGICLTPDQCKEPLLQFPWCPEKLTGRDDCVCCVKFKKVEDCRIQYEDKKTGKVKIANGECKSPNECAPPNKCRFPCEVIPNPCSNKEDVCCFTKKKKPPTYVCN